MQEAELYKLLTKFRTEAIQKYRKGRREHDEKLEDIDYFTEMKSEIMDLLIYLLLRERYQPSLQDQRTKLCKDTLNCGFVGGKYTKKKKV